MKYKNEEERKAARRLSNRLAQQRHRANIKLVKKPLTPKSTKTINVAEDYKENLFIECAKYPFSHSISLTNNKLVTLNMHNKAVMDFIDYLLAESIITNYVKTNEYLGGNFHAHLVVQEATIGTDFRRILKEKWYGNGFYRVKSFNNSNEYRLNAIKYCFKEIDVTSNRDVMQKLVDTWSISLIETFNDLKQARIAFIDKFKRANGLYPYHKNILGEKK